MSGLSTITVYESIIFFLFNFIILMIGFILWYFLWAKRHGIEIQEIVNDTLINFCSRNFGLILENLYLRIKNFDKIYIIKAMGYEAYVYLVFQKTMISLLYSQYIWKLFLFKPRQFRSFL